MADVEIAVLAVLAAAEAFRLLRAAGVPASPGIGLIAAPVAVVGTLISDPSGALAIGFVVGVLIVSAVAAFRHADMKAAFLDWMGPGFGALYVSMLAFVPAILAASATLPWRRSWAIDSIPGDPWPLVLLFGVWAYDTAAYVAGRTLGRGSFMRHISPSKTWSGVIGGLIGCTIATTALIASIPGRPLVEGIVYRHRHRRDGAGRRPRRVEPQARCRRQGLGDAAAGPRRRRRPRRSVPVRGTCGVRAVRRIRPVGGHRVMNDVDVDGERIGVAVLESTGSIGRQALDVLQNAADRFRVVALAAGTGSPTLGAQAAAVQPAVIGLTDESATARLQPPEGTAIVTGDDLLERFATRDDVQMVVVATGGIVSLRPVLAALDAGKVVATANKETLVSGGHLVMPRARALASRAGLGESPLAWLRPIDSEHSAIWQCLVGEDLPGAAVDPDRLRRTLPGLAVETPRDGHATGRSGTSDLDDGRQDHGRLSDLMNKGLEVVEARWLYDVDDSDIDVVITRRAWSTPWSSSWTARSRHNSNSLICASPSSSR